MSMEIFSQDKVFRFCIKHANAQSAFNAWLEVVERSAWRFPREIKARYPSADFLANNRVIFNIKGNHYRMVVQVNYRRGTVLVEWIGTHAQYDKQIFQ